MMVKLINQHKQSSFWMLTALLLLSACSEPSTEQINIQHPVAQHAQHWKVQAKDVPAYYLTSGTVASDHRVSMSSRLSGYIRDMKVREGDRVKAGQVLLHIDPVDAKDRKSVV